MSHPMGAADQADSTAVQRQLEFAEQLLACFQQVVGHELPNHMIAIQGLLRVLELEEGAHLGPEGQDYLRRLAASAGRVQSLTSALAEIGRARRDSQKSEVLAPLEVAREAAAEVNQLFPERTIKYHFSQATFSLVASRLALHRVFVQLFRNAVQASLAGQPAHVDIGARATDVGAELSVTDQGQGLSAERRQQIQDFLSEKILLFPGPGLGLVLVRQVLSRWNGSLRVESEEGRGAAFTILLPSSRVCRG